MPKLRSGRSHVRTLHPVDPRGGRRAARAAVEGRPEAERHLLVRHYFEGVSFDEAAKEIGLSKSWASRLHARAIEGLAKDLKRLRVT